METMKKRGFFITFEGPEGAGKSSQADKLARHLEGKGFKCLRTREPGGTPLAEELRKVLKSYQGSEKVHDETELLLMEAARSQHMHEVILPALGRGEAVICDRFYDSTTAYQGGARGLPPEVIAMLNDFASAGRKPDLTLLLDLAPECGFERISKRVPEDGTFDRFEAEKLDFHRRVRNAFLELSRKEPERVKIIDADRPMDIIFSEIRQLADELVR